MPFGAGNRACRSGALAWSVWLVWMCLVVHGDGVLWDGAVSADLEAVAGGPVVTSDVLACHREPVISARGCRVLAVRMASLTRSAARRVRFMPRSSNTAREVSSAVWPGCSRSSLRAVSASSSRLKARIGCGIATDGLCFGIDTEFWDFLDVATHAVTEASSINN